MDRLIEKVRALPPFLTMVLPATATILLILLANYLILVPLVRENLLERKKAMIHSLTDSMWSLLEHLHSEAEAGLLSREEAQAKALSFLRDIRYGTELDDYFWVHDLSPRMLMHPFRPELEGLDLSAYEDRAGKPLFVEMARTVTVKEDGEGFVEYYWQWKDDRRRVEKKLSFVKLFEPWGWIIGTGIYLEDVQQEISELTERITLVSFGVLLLLMAVSIYIVRRNYLAELNLVSTRSRLKLMTRALELTPEGIALISGVGSIRYLNAGALQQQGLTDSPSLENHSFEELLSEEGIALYRSEILPALSHQESWSGELHFLRSDGSSYPAVAIFIDINDEQGNTDYMLVSWRNIEDRVRAERALLESERRFRAIADYGHDWESWIGVDGELLWTNPSVHRILGYTDREYAALEDRFQSIFLPEDRGWVQDYIGKALREGQNTNNLELRMRRKDGGIIWVSIAHQALFDESGAYQGMRLSIRDISDRIATEVELRRGEERFRNIVESSSDAIIVVQNERTVLTNPRFSEMLGADSDQIDPQQIDVFELIEEEDRPRVRENFLRRLRGEPAPSTYRTRARRLDGELRDIELSASIIDWEGENAVLVLIRDITEALSTQRIQAEAQKLTERSARLASIGVIAAGITHEINQPLNAIRMGADGILLWSKKREQDLPPFVQQTVERISVGATRISEIINHMRRYWVKSQPGDLDTVDLASSVRSALTLIDSQAASHNIRIVTDLDDQPLRVKGISIQLEQIVLNLISNAVHVLDSSDVESALIEIIADRIDGQARLRVLDNGPGFGNIDVEELWNPFYTSRRSEDGMGLGLAIVKMFTDRVNGRITARDRKDGPGAEFEVLIPLASEDADSGEER